MRASKTLKGPTMVGTSEKADPNLLKPNACRLICWRVSLIRPLISGSISLRARHRAPCARPRPCSAVRIPRLCSSALAITPTRVSVSTRSVAVPAGTPPRKVLIGRDVCGPCDDVRLGWPRLAEDGWPWAAAGRVEPAAASSIRISGTALTEVPFSSAGKLDERAREGAGRGAWVGRCDPKDRGRIAYYARNGCGSANPSGRACRTAAQIEQSERLLDSLWGGRLDHVRLGGLHRREREMAFSRCTWPLPRVKERNR